MRSYKIGLLVTILLFLVFLSTANAQAGIYLLPATALGEFAPALYSGEDASSIQKWLERHKASPLKEGWVPTKNETRYAVYKVRLLEYWFGPYPDQSTQQSALNKLYQILQEPSLQVNKNHIYSFPVFLIPDKSISMTKLATLRGGTPFLALPAEVHKREQRIEEIVEQIKQIQITELPADIDVELKQLEEIQDKLTDEGLTDGQKVKLKNLKDKHGKSANDGASGRFPASYAFSKWFSTIVEILSEFLLPSELKKIAEKVVTMAYMIMPDVMDDIASTLAKLQDAMVPDKIENTLDKVTEVASHAYRLYKNLRKVYDLVSDPEFGDFMKDLNITDAAQHFEDFAQEEGLKMINGFTEKMSKYFPYADCFTGNMLTSDIDPSVFEDCMKQKVERQMVNQVEHLLRESGIPVLENVDIDAINDLAKGKIDVEDFAKTQIKQVGCRELARYGHISACEHFVDGQIKGAGISLVTEEIRKQTGLNTNHLKGLIQALEEEDYEKAIRHAASLPYEKYKAHFGAYGPLIQTMIDHPHLPGLQKLNSPAIDTYLQQTLGSDVLQEAAIHSFAGLLGQHTGLDKTHIEDFLEAMKEQNFEKALQSAANIPLERHAKWFGPYANAVRSFVDNPSGDGFQGSSLKAIDVLIEQVVEDSRLGSLARGSTDILLQAAQGKELDLRKNIAEVLQHELGWGTALAAAFINDDQHFDLENILRNAAEKMGIISQDALGAFANGDIEQAIDLHTAWLAQQELGDAGQVGLVKHRLKNRAEMLTILSSVLKEEMNSNQQQALQLIYEKSFQ